jgi:hypothetical protein
MIIKRFNLICLWHSFVFIHVPCLLHSAMTAYLVKRLLASRTVA